MLVGNIRTRCKRLGLTIAEVERETGIGNGVVARWDKHSPRIDLLWKVAERLGCTVDDLLKEEGHAETETDPE